LALDREDTLKKAEKLLRQGRLDGAIAEYVRIVEEFPRDWNSANALGDLYARGGQPDKAAAQYGRIAEHLMGEGFYPKAAALYKKLLKVNPDDEATQLQLAEISAKQGLLLDAKSYFNTVAAKRRARGDRAGTAEIVIRLGALDPADIDARMAAAATYAEMGDADTAAARFREIYNDLNEKGRADEALAALREAVRLNPDDKEGRGTLARACVAAGDLEAARGFLDRETAGHDPALLMALTEIELRTGNIEEARALVPEVLLLDKDLRIRLIDLAWSLTATHQDAAFVCASAVVDDYIADNQFDEAGAVLQEFATRIPKHIPSLLKLIEVCVDGGLESTMYEAQTQLTDAYLEAGQATEARVVAEDLIAREPWEKAHIERFRRALVMLRVPDPDTLIAERLSGQSPFMVTDPFIDLNEAEPPAPEPSHVEAETPSEPMMEASANHDTIAAPEPEREPEPVAPPPAVEKPVVEPVVEVASAPAAGTKTARGKKTKAVVEPPPAEIDLTSALGGLSGDDSDEPAPAAKPKKPGDLDEVFKDFRHEMTRQSGADQSAQHMTIARAYLEMGLTEEAIPALRTAAKSPKLRFEAASALARLFKSRGESVQAIEWFERAAEAPAPTVDDGRALLYDLGTTLEEAGETVRALAVFLELQAEGAEYKDVAARAERLVGMQSGG
jgi:tetratricopeptide (TPR) repeat protein